MKCADHQINALEMRRLLYTKRTWNASATTTKRNWNASTTTKCIWNASTTKLTYLKCVEHQWYTWNASNTKYIWNASTTKRIWNASDTKHNRPPKPFEMRRLPNALKMHLSCPTLLKCVVYNTRLTDASDTKYIFDGILQFYCCIVYMVLASQPSFIDFRRPLEKDGFCSFGRLFIILTAFGLLINFMMAS